MDTNTSINIIWYDGFFGCWDHGLLASVFESDSRFVQHNTKERLVFDEAIIIMGKPKDFDSVTEHLNKFKRGIVILTSDEDSEWDWRSVIPKHLTVWTQYYFHNKQEIKERLLLGFPTRLKDFSIDTSIERIYSCSFVGQVQNPYRQKCIRELKKIPNAFIQIADGFGGVNGLEYQDYLNILCQSKVVLCPSGSMCTDSFRVYEALECGALPIVEPRSPRDMPGFNYWREANPELHYLGILPCVEDWKDISFILKDEIWIKERTEQCQIWWTEYKYELKYKLLTALC